MEKQQQYFEHEIAERRPMHRRARFTDLQNTPGSPLSTG
jgi:hypothetical protein